MPCPMCQSPVPAESTVTVSARPALSRADRSTPSPIGARQMFPRQTRQTRYGSGSVGGSVVTDTSMPHRAIRRTIGSEPLVEPLAYPAADVLHGPFDEQVGNRRNGDGYKHKNQSQAG